MNSRILLLRTVFFVAVFCFFSSSVCFSQSFQWVLDSINYRMLDIAVNQDGESVLFMRKYPNTAATNCYLLPVENIGSTVQGIEIPIVPTYIRSQYNNDRIIFSTYGTGYNIDSNSVIGKSIIFNIDMASNTKWSKYLNGRFRQYQFSMDKDGNVFIVNTPNIILLELYDDHSSVLELFKLGEAGNTVWKKGLLLLDSQSVEYPNLFLRDMDLDNDSNIYVLGDCGTLSGPDGIIFPCIMKFDSTGQPVLMKTLNVEKQYFNKVEVVSDGVLLLSHAPNDPDLFNSGIFLDKYAKLIKLDFDFNFLWGKKYSGENFPYYSAGIKEMPNGNLLMSHSTFGAYPAVLTEMDSEGNILTQKGYPNFQPQIAVLDDGSFLMTSEFNYNDTGETLYQPVIAKTDTFGEIEGCENYPTCIIAEEYTVEFGTFNYDTVSIPELEDFDTLVQPVTFSFSEFCGFPPLPTPDFLHPDTLCINDSTVAMAPNNRLANAHEWHLIGPGVDSINIDYFDFSYKYMAAGDYNLKQTVWVLGCAYDFEKKITVLPEIEGDISPTYICPDRLPKIYMEAGRELISHIWNTGESTPSIFADNPGIYSVTVSDGYCKAEINGEVNFVSDIIGAEETIVLPEDTTVCEIDLPYILEPYSTFSDSFFILGNEKEYFEIIDLENAGNYSIGLELYGCPFFKEFKLSINDCEASVYFPNIFSPNGDGINDIFFPQGKGFEPIKLVIYDRWGGLRYMGAGDAVGWSPENETMPGVYLYHFYFFNLLTGRGEVLSGEVVLVR